MEMIDIQALVRDVTTHTKLPVTQISYCENLRLGHNYSLTSYLVGDYIIMMHAVGHGTYSDMVKSMDVTRKITQEFFKSQKPYIQIEDLTRFTGIDFDARKYYMAEMIQRKNLLGLIYYGTSPLFNLSIRLGKKLNIVEYPIDIAKNLPHALDTALNILKNNQIPVEIVAQSKKDHHREEIKQNYGELCYVSGLPITSKKKWTNIDLGEGYQVSFYFIGDRILHSKPIGHAGKNGMNRLFEERARVLDSMIDQKTSFIEIKDYSGIRGFPSKMIREQFATGLKKDQHRMLGYIGYNAPRTARISLNVGELLHHSPFPLLIVKNYEEAVDKALSLADPKRAVKKLKSRIIDPRQLPNMLKQFFPIQKYVDELLVFVGSINWESDQNDDRIFNYESSHPFYPVFEAIELVKNDLDTLSKERNEIVTKLSKSEERYRLLVDNANDMIYVTGVDGKLKFVNQAVIDTFGYSEKELIAMDVIELVDPSHRESITHDLKNRLSGKIPVNIPYQFMCRNKNNEEVWMEASSQFLYDENKILSVQSIARNITENRNTAMALEKSEARYKQLIDSSADAIVMYDLKGRVKYLNPAFSNIFGWTFDELKDKKIGFVPDEARIENMQAFELIHKGKIVKDFQTQRLTKNGKRLDISLSTAQVTDNDGNPTGTVVILRDETERKKSEMELKKAKDLAEAANNAKSQFLANMSHEIRTPMNGVIGMTSLLLDTSLDKEQTEIANMIRTSADSLLTIINDILDFSKMEAGQLDIEELEFDMRIMLEDISNMLFYRLKDKEIQFSCHIDPKVPVIVKGDPGRLKQILINLLGNALKFTNQGKISVAVESVKEFDLKCILKFTVKDSGIGIPENRIERLFKSFSQVDASMTRKYGGTGLGLAISKQLTELMGGTIDVLSKEGKGSTFYFTVILGKQDKPTRRTPLLSTEHLKQIRVMIVDDNSINRTILRKYLQSWGCRFDESSNAKDALAKIDSANQQNDPYKVILIDMQLPEMDGEWLGKKIYNQSLCENSAMVMLTSSGQRGDSTRLKNIGFSAYLVKPILEQQLHDCILSALDLLKRPLYERQKSIITRFTLAENKKLSPHILIVEDNAVNLKLVTRLLEKSGFNCKAATNGKEAVMALEHINYDLVLMDVQMPEMDGFEATRIIRDLKSNVINHNVPIIAMTAHAMKGDREKCLISGMNEYVAKPIKPDSLLDIIDHFLSL